MKYSLIKKSALILLSASMAFSMSACKKSDAEKRISKAQKSLSKIESMNSHLIMEGAVSMSGQSLSVTSDYDITYFAQPARMRINLDIDMGGFGNQATEMYIEEVEKSYFLYSNSKANIASIELGAAEKNAEEAEPEPPVTGPDAWSVQNIPIELFNYFNGQNSINVYLENLSGITEVGAENINGIETTRYRAFIPEDKLQSTLTNAGALSTIQSAIPTDGEDKPIDVFAGLGDLPITVWLDDVNNYPVKYELDLSQHIKNLIENIATAQKLVEGTLEDAPVNGAQATEVPTFDKLVLTMENYDFNTAVYFEIPSDALTAAKKATITSSESGS